MKKKSGAQLKKSASASVDANPKLVEDEDLMNLVQKKAAEALDLYKSQRTEFEEIWQTNDYMIKCAANRTLNQSEMVKGFNPWWTKGDQHQAETGSTSAFQHWRQMASQLIAVAFSREMPFKYTAVFNPSVFDSAEDARAMTDQWNTLALWTMKHDDFVVKFIELAHEIRRVSNVPVMFYQRRKKASVRVRIPTTNAEGKESHTFERKNLWTENWPSFKILAPEALYANVLVPSLQKQDVVIVPSLVSYAEIMERVATEEWNADQVALLSKTHRWDGSTEATGIQRKLENNDQTLPAVATDQFIAWDIFIRCPIEKNKWQDDTFAHQCYWLTVLGNDIARGIPVAFDPNPDPDGEIPIFMLHETPLDIDLLYHYSQLQAIRSNYSVECTIKNQMIDNNSEINHPPMVEVEGQVRGSDRQVRPDQVFKVDQPTSLTTMQIRDLSQHNMSLLEYVKRDSRDALHQMGNVGGEVYGGRTSATESNNAYRNAIQPHLAGTKYILWQFFTVYAKKLQSYWENYAIEGQIVSITDDDVQRIVRPEELYGLFDVVVDVVDEFLDDAVLEQRVFSVLNLLGTNQEAAKQINWAELVREWFRRSKLPPSIVKGAQQNSDARRLAQMENRTMLELGTYDPPEAGEDHDTHLYIHRSERLKYKGIEAQSGMAERIALLDQHIEQQQMLKDGEGQAVVPQAGVPGLPSGGSAGAPADAAAGAEMPGQAAGGQLAAEMGAQP